MSLDWSDLRVGDLLIQPETFTYVGVSGRKSTRQPARILTITQIVKLYHRESGVIALSGLLEGEMSNLPRKPTDRIDPPLLVIRKGEMICRRSNAAS